MCEKASCVVDHRDADASERGGWDRQSTRQHELHVPPSLLNEAAGLEEQAEVTVEFKAPLMLPGTATLWRGASSAPEAFEVRDASGDKPYLRGVLTLPLPPHSGD